MEKRFRPTIWYFGKQLLITILTTVPYLIAVPLILVYCHAFSPFNGWYLLLLIPAIPLVILFFYGWVRFFVPFYCIHKVHEHDTDIVKGRVITYYGSPGVGKTFSMTYDGVKMAQNAWSELYFSYLLQHGRFASKKYADFDNEEAEKQFETIDEAIEAMSKSGGIPLLYSNYPIEVSGQKSYILTFDHFLQKERLSEKAVVILDESADWLDNKRSLAQPDSIVFEENKLINEMTSKERHFGDWYMLFAEQNSSENYKGLRNVMTANRYLYAREELCRPIRLMKKYEKLKYKVLKHGNCSAGRFEKIKPLYDRINKIGFFKIYYRDRGNQEESNAVIDEGYYILPINNDFKYATRAYQFQYKALEKEISTKTYDSLYLHDDSNAQVIDLLTDEESMLLWKLRGIDELQKNVLIKGIEEIPAPGKQVVLTEAEKDFIATYRALGKAGKKYVGDIFTKRKGGTEGGKSG